MSKHNRGNKKSKTEIIQVDLPTDTYEEIKSMAKLAGVTFNQFVSVILTLELCKVKPPTVHHDVEQFFDMSEEANDIDTTT